MNTIMFATDLSPENRNAFRLACGMANALKAKLLIVHAGEPDENRLDNWSGVDPDAQFAKFVPESFGIDYKYLVQPGDPAKLIRSIERSHNVDLIVLGTHGRTGMDRLFTGSVAEKVIRAANCPVVTLRQETPVHLPTIDGTGKRILVPTDFSAQSYAAIAFASSIAGPIHAKITILNVAGATTSQGRTTAKRSNESGISSDELLQQLKHVTPTTSGVEFEHEVLRGDASAKIVRYANDRKFDFVVLGTHGRSGLGRALVGSVAEQVVRNCRSPVICVKLSNKPPSNSGVSKSRKSKSSATIW
jgi:nucleotide-binding universal stress UspA family protein